MIKYIEKVVSKQNLTEKEAQEAFDIIMSGNATPAQIAGFIVALRMKGESIEEIAGGATSMRRHAVFIDSCGKDVIDTCGTGGDQCNTFNISTATAIVAAAAGVPVSKHGNRAVSSKCGSADVLEALGVNINAAPEIIELCIKEIGLGFLFAPGLHPAMKHAAGPRRELGIRTVFNMLGPLTNPAGAKRQLIGVFSPSLTETFAHVLRILGSERAIIVHGSDGMDEITTTGPTRVTELINGEIKTYNFDPLPFIGEYAKPEYLKGGDAQYNAEIIRRILKGEKGPERDIVCLNTAAAIVVGGKAENMLAGFYLAQETIDSGKAAKLLENFIKLSNSFK